MEITLVQTLQDRGHENAKMISKEGPYPCRKPGAWLGEGYYFWDTHRELGHLWGKSAYSKSGYVISEAEGRIDSTCWDLHGNGRHLKEFKEFCDFLVELKLIKETEVTVPQVINFLKKKNQFKYLAIRALGIKSLGWNLEDRTYVYRVKFNPETEAYLMIIPPIQLCLLKKKALSLHAYHIVYPEKYTNN